MWATRCFKQFLDDFGRYDLTPKWKVGVSTGYDFKGKGITYTQFRFDRDLESWDLNFSWVPFSDRASWYFCWN